MVDDKTACRTEALGSWVGPVAVAGHDEQVRAFGSGGDLPFGPPPAQCPGAGPRQAARGGVEQLGGRSGGELLDPASRVPFGVAPASSPA